MCVAVKYVLIHQDLHLPFMFLLCVPPTTRGFGYGIGPLSVHHHRCPGEGGEGNVLPSEKGQPTSHRLNPFFSTSLYRTVGQGNDMTLRIPALGSFLRICWRVCGLCAGEHYFHNGHRCSLRYIRLRTIGCILLVQRILCEWNV